MSMKWCNICIQRIEMSTDHYPKDFSTRNLVWFGHLDFDSTEHILPVDYQR
jgi:hypothetical protein